MTELVLVGKRQEEVVDEEQLKIELYATRPDKEYADLIRKAWNNTWDNGLGYSDWGYQDKKYADASLLRKDDGLASTNDRLFGEMLVLRKDGFLFSHITDSVFCADEKAMAFLATLKDRTVAEVRTEHPAIAKKLMF